MGRPMAIHEPQVTTFAVICCVQSTTTHTHTHTYLDIFLTAWTASRD